jgi:hypothetical protein
VSTIRGTRSVVPAPGEHAHAVALAPADEAEAVVLDLGPLRPGRHGMAEGRKARLNEAGRATSRSGRAPEHGAYIAAAGIASREWLRQPFANHVELSNQPITPFDEACTWNRFWSNASVSGRMRFGTRLGDPKGLPSCTGLLRSERFSLPLLDRWPKRSESLFRANRLVARNPLRRELARQRDISYGPSGAWNRGAAFRISEMSGQSHPPKPPVLGRIRLKGAAPSRELRPISFSVPSFVEVRLSWFVFQLPNTTRVHV